jgi:hypothetical protein
MSEQIIPTMPFGDAKQEAIVAWALHDARFFEGVQTSVKDKDLTDAHLSRVYKAGLDFFEKFGRLPTTQEIQHEHMFTHARPRRPGEDDPAPRSLHGCARCIRHRRPQARRRALDEGEDQSRKRSRSSRARTTLRRRTRRSWTRRFSSSPRAPSASRLRRSRKAPPAGATRRPTTADSNRPIATRSGSFPTASTS